MKCPDPSCGAPCDVCWNEQRQQRQLGLTAKLSAVQSMMADNAKDIAYWKERALNAEHEIDDQDQLRADERVATFDRICKWLDAHGYRPAALHLSDVRRRFLLPDEDVEQDSPPFRPLSADDFEARGFQRVSRNWFSPGVNAMIQEGSEDEHGYLCPKARPGEHCECNAEDDEVK